VQCPLAASLWHYAALDDATLTAHKAKAPEGGAVKSIKKRYATVAFFSLLNLIAVPLSLFFSLPANQ
jgi:hypothetical protein